MATNEDSVRLLVSIEANQRAFAKDMAKVVKQSTDAAKYIEDNFNRANDNAAKSFQAGGKKAAVPRRAARSGLQSLFSVE
jgi:hypothetical protein